MTIRVPENLLRQQLLLAGALACTAACDPVQYPEGFTYILDTDAGPKLASGAWDIVTASSDNVSLYGHVNLRPETRSTYFLTQAGLQCEPWSAVGTVPGGDYRQCEEWYQIEQDRRLEVRYWNDSDAYRQSFYTGMKQLPSNSSIWVPSYQASAALPGFLYRASDCPGGDCMSQTFPWMGSNLRLPLDPGGNVQPVLLELRLAAARENLSRSLGRPLLLQPAPNLIVVPVHWHTFQTNLARPGELAEQLATTTDDPGAIVGSTVPKNQFQNAAKLTRPLGDKLPRNDTERMFAECGVQLRTASVQFHVPEKDLLENGRVNAHCGAGSNSAGCKDSMCKPFLAKEPLGKKIAQFAGAVGSIPAPQGLHVVLIDGLVFDFYGDYVGGGWGCTTHGNPDDNSFAIALGSADLAIHEMSHALGIMSETVVENAVNLNQPWVGDSCAKIRTAAQQIVALSP